MKEFIVIFFAILVFHNSYSQQYYKDIEPIILAKCATCHKPGETAPFSLLTYNDVYKRANFIRNVIVSKYMPPWKADNDYRHFSNDRSLSDAEIKLISDWVQKGSPKGSGTDNEKVIATLQETSYGRIPDVTYSMLDTFALAGNNKEKFVTYRIPFENADSAAIEAVEFLSSNKRLIHHANYAVYEVDDQQNRASFPKFVDMDIVGSGVDPFKALKKNIVYYGGWIPGSGIETYPKTVGWVLPKKGVILLTVHYSGTPIPEKSLSQINLFFSKHKIERKVKVISFGSGGIGEREIRPYFFLIPKDKISSYVLKLSNPSDDFSVMYVWPHMHYIGKSFKAYAINTKKDTIPLVHVAKWDFRWQEMYKFRKLVRIEKGSEIHIECEYDNTNENPFNPFVPAQNIFSYGAMNATQEMMTMLMVFLPYKIGDEEVLLE